MSLAALLIGIAISFAAGAAYKHMRIAFEDLRTTKAKIKPLRRIAWRITVIRLLKTSVIIVVAIIAGITWTIRTQHPSTGPAPLTPAGSSAGPHHTPKHPYVPKTFRHPNG